MKCSEVRNLVLPYVDSELDARTSQEIELHLESCAECAELFQREQRFNEKLSRLLRTGEASEDLWRRIETELRPPAPATPLRRTWKHKLMAAAAVLIVGVAAAVMLWPHRTFDLARVAKADHAKFVAGQTAPEFTGPAPADLAQRSGGRLDASAFRAVPAAAGYVTEGGRLCHLTGVPVALTLGRFNGVPVSCFVFKKDELAHFPQAKARLEAGHPVVCTRAGRFQFAARVLDGHVVCALGELPQEQLEDLLRSVPGAG